MPGEFVESKIKYYKMRKDVYAKGGCGEIHLGVGRFESRVIPSLIQYQNHKLQLKKGIRIISLYLESQIHSFVNLLF